MKAASGLLSPGASGGLLAFGEGEHRTLHIGSQTINLYLRLTPCKQVFTFTIIDGFAFVTIIVCTRDLAYVIVRG